jgi:uncharacterized protein YndB with AHSA1/START domain
MSVTDVRKDVEANKFAITAEFEAPIDRVWQLWADPRQLERWWGPPGYPATFVDYEFKPGGRVTYYMTGPGGERYGGWWRVVSVEAPSHFAFEDGFSDEDGRPKDDLPVSSAVVTLSEVSGGTTRMVIETTYSSREDLEKILEMGMEEGMKAALGQIDDLLKEAA